MNIQRRSLLLTAGALLAGAAQADTPYPSKPVTLMVPYPVGGTSDVTARTVAEPLAKLLGQPVIVENLGGVSGALAAQKVLAASADGHYLYQGSPNEVILSPLANASVKLKAEDFRLIQPVAVAPLVIMARKGLAVKTVDELVDLARKSSKDRPLTYGSVGIGSFYHLITEQMAKSLGLQLVHIPYKGGAPLLQDLMGGQLDFTILPYGAPLVGMAAEGRVLALATLEPARLEVMKEMPSVNESRQLKGFNYSIWTGYMVPRATPEAVVVKLHQALGKVLAEPKVRAELEKQGQAVAQPMPLSEASRFYAAEIERYRAVARSINLQPQ